MTCIILQGGTGKAAPRATGPYRPRATAGGRATRVLWWPEARRCVRPWGSWWCLWRWAVWLGGVSGQVSRGGFCVSALPTAPRERTPGPGARRVHIQRLPVHRTHDSSEVCGSVMCVSVSIKGGEEPKPANSNTGSCNPVPLAFPLLARLARLVATFPPSSSIPLLVLSIVR